VEWFDYSTIYVYFGNIALGGARPIGKGGSMKNRYIQQSIQDDALMSKKMAIITGPRQVGKTTMVQNILEEFSSNQNYFNFDDEEFRKIWIKNPKALIPNTPQSLVAFDEIHKDRKWKNKLKGLYDLYGKSTNFVITGSARLDFYRKSGDSLQGRYFPYRLHPFTYGETSNYKGPPEKEWIENSQNSNSNSKNKHNEIIKINDLINLGGFPEPLLGGNLSRAKRWQRLYRERLIEEDVRDLQNIRELRNLENLTILLRERIGSQLSYESLRQDLSCSPDSVFRWIQLLETLYYCYTIRPYSKNIKNSLKKEPKVFLYDWAQVDSESKIGANWENMIGSHLLKNVHAWTDMGEGEFELFYLRDKQKREVDFFVTKNKHPYLMLEVKSNNPNINPSLIYYQKLLKPQFCIQLIKNSKGERFKNMAHPEIMVMSAEKFLAVLN
jgi:predicted AAA+ superfamily ATPase